MKSFSEQLALYRQQKHQGNKLAYDIGVPAFLIGILILLSWISITIAGRMHVSFAWLAVIGVLIYYYLLDMKLAAATTVILFIVTLLCTWIAFPAPTVFSFLLFVILFGGGGALILMRGGAQIQTNSLCSMACLLLIAPLALVADGITALGLQKSFNLPPDRVDPFPGSNNDPHSNKNDDPL